MSQPLKSYSVRVTRTLPGFGALSTETRTIRAANKKDARALVASWNADDKRYPERLDDGARVVTTYEVL